MIITKNQSSQVLVYQVLPIGLALDRGTELGSLGQGSNRAKATELAWEETNWNPEVLCQVLRLNQDILVRADAHLLLDLGQLRKWLLFILEDLAVATDLQRRGSEVQGPAGQGFSGFRGEASVQGTGGVMGIVCVVCS